MGFQRITLNNFRNLKNQVIDTSANEIFLVGENGQGKSNFLEAIYYLNYGSSFRTYFDKEVIKKEENFFIIKGVKSYSDMIPKEIIVSYDKEKKSIIIDNKSIDDRKILVELNPCIIFSHDDIKFINGPPSFKRKFFDQTISLFYNNYIDNLRDYNKYLKMRNVAIKNNQVKMIDAIDKNFVKLGFEIQNFRKKIIDEVGILFSDLFQKITSMEDELKILYKPSWRNFSTEESILNYLKNQRKNDFRWKTTTSGPHRDKFTFLLNRHDFIKTASTGQIRMIALVLKLVQSHLFIKLSDKYPIIIIDDALLELDVSKRIRFFNILPKYDQAFFAFLPDEPFKKYAGADTIIYKVKDGMVLNYG
ncbi:MAG: DNA replication/repair protein RecF [Cyclobacteriaceae bacterium]